MRKKRVILPFKNGYIASFEGEAQIIEQSSYSSKWHELDKEKSVLNYIKFIAGTVHGKLNKKT